jgi:hypothetical protein
MDPSACLCLLMDPRMPMPPYDPRTGGVGKPMPPYDPRTGGLGKPPYDPRLPVMPPMDDGTTIAHDPMTSDGCLQSMPPMDDGTTIGYDRRPPMMPVGTPVDQRPMFAPQRMPAFSPPPDSGVGALFAPANAPRFMADGGMVQHFQDGSGEAGVTPSGTYSPEIIAETLRRMGGMVKRAVVRFPCLHLDKGLKKTFLFSKSFLAVTRGIRRLKCCLTSVRQRSRLCR